MLDKGKRMWYNSQAVREERQWSLKIEQQERSTKQKAKCKSRQRVIYTQQVKEAKN